MGIKSTNAGFLLTHGIEIVVARSEAQLAGERGEEIEDRPGDDYHVVDRNQGNDH